MVLLADEGVLIQRQLISRSLKGESAADLFGVGAEESTVHVPRRRLSWRGSRQVLITVVDGSAKRDVKASVIAEWSVAADVYALNRVVVHGIAVTPILEILINLGRDRALAEIRGQ